MQHPHRQRPPALRADAARRQGLRRLPADIALAVPVVVVFALLRIELQGAGETLRIARPERLVDPPVRQLRVETGRLASQLLRRVRVRVRDNGEIVQARQPPVHRRIGRQSRLHREDVGQQILVALLQTVEPRTGPQHREVRCPDVRRNEQHLRAHLQTDLEQVAAVQPQNRPAVRLYVADRRQPPVQPFGRLEVRQNDHIVHLARLVVLLVDRTDLHRQHEAHRPPTALGQFPVHRPAPFLPQPEQPLLGRLQLFPQFGQPGRMGEIPGAHHVDPLERRPAVHILRIQLPAGRPGIARVQMHVDYKAHVTPLSDRMRETAGFLSIDYRASPYNPAGRISSWLNCARSSKFIQVEFTLSIPKIHPSSRRVPQEGSPLPMPWRHPPEHP